MASMSNVSVEVKQNIFVDGVPDWVRKLADAYGNPQTHVCDLVLALWVASHKASEELGRLRPPNEQSGTW